MVQPPLLVSTLSSPLPLSTTSRTAGAASLVMLSMPAVREVVLSGSGEDKVDTSSGGCTIGGSQGPADPLLWTLVLIAAAWLLARRRRHGRASPKTTTAKEPLN